MKRLFPGFGSDRATDDVVTAPEPGTDGPLVSAAGTERRHALLIGNGAYRDSPLRNPIRDTSLVGDALGQLGFEVTLIRDGDLASMRSAVADFALRLGASDPHSVALFYFAGHGLQGGGTNYLIPAQADIPALHDLPARALALDDVVALLSKKPRNASIIVLDACRSIPAADTAAADRGFSGGLAALDLPPAGMLVAYSTAAGRAADDGSGRNSPYAEALVETLPGLLEPGRRVHDVFVETADKVRTATGGQQNPALFLQGGLAALVPAPQDDIRRASYDPWGPARARRVALRTGSTIFALMLAVTAGLIWTQAYPERKQAMLAAIGLAEAPGSGLSCKGRPSEFVQDRYGLSAADWCDLLPLDIDIKTGLRFDLAETVAQGTASGDPKALFLRAYRTVRTAPDLPLDQQAAVASDLDRAARSGLPIAAFFRDFLAKGGEGSTARKGLEWAASEGHLPSRVRLADRKARAGDTKTAILELEELRPGDRTGFAASALSDIYSGDASDRDDVDLAKSIALAQEAARKGYVPAIDKLFALQNDGFLEISAEDDRYYRSRYAEAGVENGYWQTVKNLMSSGRDQDTAAALDALRMLKDRFDDDRAAFDFASLAIGRQIDMHGTSELSDALDQAVRGGISGARTLRGKGRMGLVTDDQGLPILPIDAPGALTDLQNALELSRDPQAALLLARYFLLGVGDQVDLRKAEDYLHRVLDSDGPQDRATRAEARHLLATITNMRAIAANPSPADLDFGDAAAPVSVVVFFDPHCPSCASPAARTDLSPPCDTCVADLVPTLDRLLSIYVEKGLARIRLLPVVPDGSAMEPLAALACLNRPVAATALRQVLHPTPADTSPSRSICTDQVDTELITARNLDRNLLLRSLILAADAPMTPAGLPGQPASPTASAPLLPTIVVNGGVLTGIGQAALADAVFRQLSPERQALARFSWASACKGADVEQYLDALRPAAAPPETTTAQAIFCDAP
jgi:TPR repeat protein